MADAAISLVERPEPDVAGLVALALRVARKTATDLSRDGIVRHPKSDSPVSQQQVSDRLLGKVDFRAADLTRIAEYLGLPSAGLFFGSREALLDAMKESTSARLWHGPLVGLPSMRDRRYRSSADRPLLTVVQPT